VESDLKKMKVKGWKEKMRNREQWRLVVKEAKAQSGLQRRGRRRRRRRIIIIKPIAKYIFGTLFE
jgi:hypothetical protein